MILKLPINPDLLLEAFHDDNRIIGLAAPYLLKPAGYTLEREKSCNILVAPGQRRKVRVLTKGGLSLGPSVGKGAGRSFSQASSQEALEAITDFVIVDGTRLDHELIYWVLPVERVEALRQVFNKDYTCNRQVALEKVLT